MHTVVAVLVAAVAVCAIARPPAYLVGPTRGTTRIHLLDPEKVHAPSMSQDFLKEYLMPSFLLPRYLGAEESPHIPPPPNSPVLREHDWLNKEIDRINRMEDEDESSRYEVDLPQWIAQDPYTENLFEYSLKDQEMPSYGANYLPDRSENYQRLPPQMLLPTDVDLINQLSPQNGLNIRSENPNESAEERDIFAFTPLDRGYYEPDEESDTLNESTLNGPQEGTNVKFSMELESPRQIRQNPNRSKMKTLLSENLERFQNELAHKGHRLPVSLLPTNLRWLRLDHPIDDEESSNEDAAATNKPHHSLVHETSAVDPANSIYGVALIAAIGAAFAMAIFGFAFGWYTLSKKAKAAADVDYPAYGVTGPSVDTSGDRKLAQSAHMYHYQHQKQQIIAMERNGLDHPNCSVSDPESEEENEEGDYTVYECPGFATTGDMEVKNPMFSEDPTPATPGKCEVVKPQPKE